MNPLNVDAVFCLCLDKRQDLWKPLVEMTWDFGWNTTPFIVGDGVNLPNRMYDLIDENVFPPKLPESTNYMSWHNRPNAYNAWKSHKKIIDICLKEDYEKVMFMEDDILLSKNFNNDIKEIEEFFLNISFDMLYLGSYTDIKNIDKVDNRIFKLNGNDCGGLHGLIVNKKILKKMSNFLPFGPFDWMCNKYLHKIFDCYVVYPSLILQKSGHSYVENSWLDKNSHL